MAFTSSRVAILCYCFKTTGETQPNSISKLSRSFSSSACVFQLVSDVAAVEASSLLIHRKVKQWWFELGITFDFVYAAAHPSNHRLQHLCLSRLTVSPLQSRHRFMLIFISDPPPNSDSPPRVAKAR
ncbi:hypothetical protein F2Q69_00014381 [Brassica cretica]|uniref:Uncharacterized protein n=1 Tax=Brassica cretica TaxID=69181 RepID=A0A8S9R4U4_BRACR|nr:hypothetical protein F2Q69_00014381 [Brassica cretica]